MKEPPLPLSFSVDYFTKASGSSVLLLIEKG
jgi:hypothetical protein